MAKAIIVFASRTGETEAIADLIAEGLRFSGHEVHVVPVNKIASEKDLSGYDCYVFGSATYHGGMMEKMKTMLFMAEKAGLENKLGGSFGAFGWSGEAPERIYDTMENIFKMDMVGDPLMLKSSKLGGGLQMAQDYGKKLAAKLMAS